MSDVLDIGSKMQIRFVGPDHRPSISLSHWLIVTWALERVLDATACFAWFRRERLEAQIGYNEDRIWVENSIRMNASGIPSLWD